jgi:type II secretory pathway component PulJ
MDDQGWNNWLQGHLANERSQNVFQVVQTINELLEPRDAEIAELRRQIAELRAELRGNRQVRRRETKPNRFDPAAHSWTDAELKMFDDAAAAALERLNKEHQ